MKVKKNFFYIKRKSLIESKPKQSCERPVDVCAYYHTDPIPCAVNLLAPGARPLPLPPDTTHTQVNINKPPETLQSDYVCNFAFVYLVLSPCGRGQLLSPPVRNPLRSPQPSLTTANLHVRRKKKKHSVFICKLYI